MIKKTKKNSRTIPRLTYSKNINKNNGININGKILIKIMEKYLNSRKMKNNEKIKNEKISQKNEINS